jgi:hypothetical protein
MSEVREGSEDDEALEPKPDSDDDADGDSADNREDRRPFIPDADAGTTQADKYSRDEKEHGRQDHGP